MFILNRSKSVFTDTDVARKKAKNRGRVREHMFMEETSVRQRLAVQSDHASSIVAKLYLALCYYAWIVQTSSIWNQYILSCIILAGALVGVQTYPNMEENVIVSSLDEVVLYSFVAEIILKVLSEGLRPQWFILCKKDRHWNIFDVVVVVACLPIIPINGKQIAILRLLRLARLGKLFRRIPQLQMVISGLITGMKSIFYILVLEILICYVYAVAGILFFRNYNDPYHFRSVEVAFLTLKSILTYDNWGDILYTNYYGCDNYGSSVLGYYTNIPSHDEGRLGGMLYCANPTHSTGSKVLTIIWFFTFVFLAGYAIKLLSIY